MKLRGFWHRGWLLLLAVAVGTATAVFSPLGRPRPAPSPPPPAAAPAAPSAEAAPAAPVIGPEMRLRYEITYLLCSLTLAEEQPAPPNLQGMDRAALQRLYPQWDVVAWGANTVTLARRTTDLCPEYREWRTVRLEDGEVVVYYGRRGSRLLKERTGITAEMLSAEEQSRLTIGIDLPGDAAVEAYLEGDH